MPLDIAVQLYTLRDPLGKDLEGTLAALVGTGVVNVELAGMYGRSAEELRAALDAAGLTAIAAHVPLERFEQEPGAVLEEAVVLGTGTLVVASVPAPSTAAEADSLVAQVTRAASAAEGGGLAFAYHNHEFEFRALEDGGDLWSRLFEAGHEHELDVGWARVAGRDPVAMLGELQGRCPLVHAKDVRRAGDGWEDVPAGDGELDWPAIVAAARDAGTGWLVIELDHPSADPIADVARSHAALRSALA